MLGTLWYLFKEKKNLGNIFCSFFAFKFLKRTTMSLFNEKSTLQMLNYRAEDSNYATYT